MEKTNYLYNVRVDLVAGNGGNGCVSFRRERHVPRGGPDGGDGGRGGSIYLKGAAGTLTLADFRYHRIWRAGNGGDGSGQNRSGSSGYDVTIDVPQGTQVWNDDRSEIILDVMDTDNPYLCAEGGRGGLGNQHFATPELQAPAISTKGALGENKTVWLVLKYMADIGVLGMPNAGKSTFVHKISRANVKIGDYPFTTINPVLGVIEGRGITVADLPGLIEGSHMNIGLGHQFLQHLERCRVLVHMVDVSDPDLHDTFSIIQNEVREYDPNLLGKTYFVCLTKADLADEETIEQAREHFKSLGYNVLVISEHDQASVDAAVEALVANLALDQMTEEDEVLSSESIIERTQEY